MHHHSIAMGSALFASMIGSLTAIGMSLLAIYVSKKKSKDGKHRSDLTF